MKFRLGFVTNSSSSSFIFWGEHKDFETFEGLISLLHSLGITRVNNKYFGTEFTFYPFSGVAYITAEDIARNLLDSLYTSGREALCNLTEDDVRQQIKSANYFLNNKKYADDIVLKRYIRNRLKCLRFILKKIKECERVICKRWGDAHDDCGAVGYIMDTNFEEGIYRDMGAKGLMVLSEH